MKHPKSEDILTVIRNFEKVLPMAKHEKHLDMDQPYVTSYSKCGTCHCHGGWYALSVCDLSKYVGFEHGMQALCEQLGFNDSDQFRIWKNANGEIWGNDIIASAFGSNHMAFYHPTKRPYGASSLQDIVDHWKEVYARVKALEEAQEGKSKPKTHLPVPHPQEMYKVVEERIDVIKEPIINN